MKRTIAVLALLVFTTFAKATYYIGDFSGYYEPTKCQRGYSADVGEFSFTVSPGGIIDGSFTTQGTSYDSVGFTGKVGRTGRIHFGPELRWEGIHVSARITKDRLVLGHWHSKRCHGTISGSPDF